MLFLALEFLTLGTSAGSCLLHFSKENLTSSHLSLCLGVSHNRMFCFQGFFCLLYFKHAMMFLKMPWKGAGKVIDSFVQTLPVWMAEAEGFQGSSSFSFVLVLLISHLKWSAKSHVYEDTDSLPSQHWLHVFLVQWSPSCCHFVTYLNLFFVYRNPSQKDSQFWQLIKAI